MSSTGECLTETMNECDAEHDAKMRAAAHVTGETLVELLLSRAEKTPYGLAIVAHQNGAWRPIQWRELADDVLRTCSVLQRLGVRPGDRVVQVSENRYEWIVTDLAILFAAAVHVPIHATLAGPQIVEQIADCGAKLVLVSGAEQARKLACSGELLAGLSIWSYDHAEDSLSGVRICRLADAVAEVSQPSPAVAWDAKNRVVAEDLATIIYTSGTTGEPKGVMLTHGNLTANALGTLAEFDFCAEDVRLGFLPLSHVFARTCDLYCSIACGGAIAIARSRETVLVDCGEVRPTMLNGVPYFFEKVMRAAQEHGGVLAEYFGGRLRYACSGGAALPDHVATFYAERGISLVQGYGLTETSPVMTISTPQCNRTGTVGRAIRGVELRIARDGEILTRGPHVMVGYWNRSEATAEILREGWLHTGDLGEIDADGFLRITGRKKEIIVTAAGKNIAPVRIETLLTEDPLIAQAIVIGDARNYLAALIVLDAASVEREMAAHTTETAARDDANGTDDAEAAHHVLRHMLALRIAERLACLSHYEQVRRFAILPAAFSIEAGELTPTLKLRRQVIARRYAAEIESMYVAEQAQSAVSCPSQGVKNGAQAGEELHRPAVFDRLCEMLNASGVGYRVSRHAAVFTSEAAATVRGVPLASGAKALVCKADERFVMIVLPADRKLASKATRAALGAKSLRFADREEVLRLTGLVPGSIPPFGSLFGLSTYCDARLGEQPTINFNAGDHAISISLTHADYLAAERPQLGAFAD